MKTSPGCSPQENHQCSFGAIYLESNAVYNDSKTLPYRFTSEKEHLNNVFHNLTNVKEQGAVIQTTSESFLIVQRFLAWCSLSVLKCAKRSREIKSVQQEPQIKLSSFQYQNLQRKYKFEFHVNLWQWGKALCPGSCTSAGVLGAVQRDRTLKWKSGIKISNAVASRDLRLTFESLNGTSRLRLCCWCHF